MGKAVFIGEVSALNQRAVRQTIIRIPQVGIRLREVQGLFEKWNQKELDVYSILDSEDSKFESMGPIRSALFAAIQLGLFDRLIANGERPRLMIGQSGSLPLLRVLSGQLTLEEMLAPAFVPEQVVNLAAAVVPQTTSAFDIIRPLQTSVLDVPLCSAQNPLELIFWLSEEEGISQLINLGPGESISCQQFEATPERIQISESISMDPGLSWFWSALRAAC